MKPNRIKDKNHWKDFFLTLSAIMLFLFLNNNAYAQQKNIVVHIAKLQIDSAQLENYKAALKEHAETAVRVEPGVLTLYAVYEEKHPTNVTVFEVYSDSAAYHAHLKSPHFLKYKAVTKAMVKSLELVPVMPIVLAGKLGSQN
jgi:quinol monooxygenase YgiN